MQDRLAVRGLEAADRRAADASPQDPGELGPAGEADHAAVIRPARARDVEDLPVELVDAQALRVARLHQQALVKTPVQGRVETGAERDRARSPARDEEIGRVPTVGRQPDHRAADGDHLAHNREIILQLVAQRAAADGVLGLVEAARDHVVLIERGVEDVLHVPEDLDDPARAARPRHGGEGGAGGLPALAAGPPRHGRGGGEPAPRLGPGRGQISERRQVRREARDLDHVPAVLLHGAEQQRAAPALQRPQHAGEHPQRGAA